MIIHGFNKLTLLDYPQHTACTVFTAGCNFRCPFCHNAPLVLQPSAQPVIAGRTVLEYLDKRKNVIEGVCITGGEPTLCEGLESFITQIKDKGFLVKLDTNGSNPQLLKHLIDNKKIDYVAMDIKNSLSRYGQTVDVKNFDTAPIEQSVKIIMSSNIDYEFRTTVVKQYHDEQSFLEIGQWIKGAKKYALQNFCSDGELIQQGLGSHTADKLRHFASLLSPFVEKVILRGI